MIWQAAFFCAERQFQPVELSMQGSTSCPDATKTVTIARVPQTALGTSEVSTLPFLFILSQNLPRER